jgi:hypothetical protein
MYGAENSPTEWTLFRNQWHIHREAVEGDGGGGLSLRQHDGNRIRHHSVLVDRGRFLSAGTLDQ